jgi:myosin-5
VCLQFHVFYHVFEESTLDKSAWQLGPKESYHYINQSGTFGASNVDDKSGENGVDAVIKSLQQATDGDDAYVQDVYTIIAAILWLGNVEFTGGEGATVKDPKPLEHAASLLGCTPEQLEFALTHSTKEIMGEKISANLKPADAVGSRDALARNMYGRVFDDVVSRWNTCLQLEDSEDAPAVGVLDIFGFESFEVNSFEQFCINFTNEKLQATFNQHIFKEEIHTYFEEQIQWQGITFPDNADALSVIGGKGVGVFDQLDGICKQRSAKDAQFCDMLHNQWDGKKNPAWPRTDPRKIKNHFTVKHYAGPVVYCTDNWVIKNKDTISPDITDLCRNQCGQDLVKELWASGRFGTLTTTTATGQKIHKQFMGLGKAFMKSINALTVQIDSTHVHFIRTLKTNAAMKPGYYQPDYVIAQLRDQGLLALCDLLKAGYPTRIGYGELQERFAVKMPAEINNMGLDPRSYVSALVWAYGLPKANYQCGLTKIFFRAGKVAMLDDLDNIQPAEHEHLVERVKRWVVRRRWRMGTAKAIAQVRAMQLYRSVHAMHLWSKGAGLMLVYIRTLRNIYHRIKGKVAARSVARVCRMWPVRKEYLKKTVETRKKKAAVVIESVCRAHIARKAYEEKVAAKKEAQAATMLEALCRMMLTQKATHELFGARREEKAAKVLQAAARMYAERKAFLHTKSVGTEAATKVQRLYRLLSGESGVEFKSICKQMLHMRSSFFARMDAMAEKYSSPESQPMGTRKMFKGGGGGGPGFEMWISIKLVSPHAEESDGPIKDKWGQTQLHDEVFASTSMKMRRVPGVLGAFFKDPANAALADADGNCVSVTCLCWPSPAITHTPSRCLAFTSALYPVL